MNVGWLATEDGGVAYSHRGQLNINLDGLFVFHPSGHRNEKMDITLCSNRTRSCLHNRRRRFPLIPSQRAIVLLHPTSHATEAWPLCGDFALPLGVTPL